MRNFLTLLSAACLVFALDRETAAAQDSKKPASKAEITRPIPETIFNRDAFTGNEVRIAAMNSVNADCSSGPVASVRIVTAAQNGEQRLEEITTPVDRKEGNRRASCNGKPVQAVGVFYKSNAGFTGKDNIVIDVDFKSGTVRRYNYKITVR